MSAANSNFDDTQEIEPIPSDLIWGSIPMANSKYEINSAGYLNTDAKRRRQFERIQMIALASAAVVIVLVAMQVISWGSYSLEVLPLQIGDFAGLNSRGGLQRFSEICLDLKKYDCVEEMYRRSAANDTAAVGRLGRFQYKRLKYSEAAQTLGRFFALGGQDVDLRYLYAKALSESGMYDDAAKVYEDMISQRPEVLQVTVVQNYVRMLVDQGQPERALKVIDTIRKRDKSVEGFMDVQYKEIKKKTVSGNT